MPDHRTHKQLNRSRNAAFVNSLKLERGCARCDFKPSSEIECRLLDLHHKRAQEKKAKLSRLVWGHAGLETIKREIAKGEFLCKLCHAREHAKAKKAR